jgi:hypothetical protein
LVESDDIVFRNQAPVPAVVVDSFQCLVDAGAKEGPDELGFFFK